MIDPNGPKPDRHRRPGTTEPHFEQDDAPHDQPMYATEPDGAQGAGAQWPGSRGPGDASGAEQGGAWQGQPAGQADVSGQATQGQGPEGQRQDGTSAAGQGLSAELAELKAALAAAETKAKEAGEQYLRALAETENVRRRAQDDVSKAHKFAIESFAESLLPVRDSLEMALSVEVPSVESMREGVEATLRQLTQAFERNRLMVIDPLHQKFDPHLHQAISVAPSRDVAPNHVVSVLQKGYMINDRILRPALVTVSQPA